MENNRKSQLRYQQHRRFIRRNEVFRQRRKRHEERQAKRMGLQKGTVVHTPSRFELAPQIKIEELWPQVKFLLKAFGFPGALVTDESIVWDMVPDGGRKLIAIRRKLRVSITMNDYIFTVAQKLLQKQQNRDRRLHARRSRPSAFEGGR